MASHTADDCATAKDTNAFDPLKIGLSLISQLPSGDNSVISPLSIATVLAMLYSGARSITRQELENVLHMSSYALSNFIDSIGKLPRCMAGEGTQLRSSTAAYTAGDLTVESEYRQSLARLEATIAHLDFAKDPEVAREQINRWIDEATLGLVKNLLPPGTITIDTCLVLANAVYFKGLWNKPFDIEQTRAADFHLGAGRTVTAQMMSLSSRFRYAVDQKRRLQLLLLPYSGVSQLNMLLLLPFEGSQLDETVGLLNGKVLASAVASMESVQVDVVLPRFSISSFFDVKSGLSALGITSLFDSSSDLSGISSSRKLGVSACLHRAVIEVSEEGTVAAAATGAMLSYSCIMRSEKFVCDRPFAFTIWHEATASALFLGRVDDPTHSA